MPSEPRTVRGIALPSPTHNRGRPFLEKEKHGPIGGDGESPKKQIERVEKKLFTSGHPFKCCLHPL
ncbi:MAG: hypothetical protein MJA29_13450, partial [Candidatus Omnitrophica bacterium]|nr:hypothetical protein [Candidatus Omnitrophota bacterium]